LQNLGQLGGYVQPFGGQFTLALDTPKHAQLDRELSQELRDYFAAGGVRDHLPHVGTRVGKYLNTQLERGLPLGAEMKETLKDYNFGNHLVTGRNGGTHLSKSTPKHSDWRISVLAEELRDSFHSGLNERGHLPDPRTDIRDQIFRAAISGRDLKQPIAQVLRSNGFENYLYRNDKGWTCLSENTPGVAEEKARRAVTAAAQAQEQRRANVFAMQPPPRPAQHPGSHRQAPAAGAAYGGDQQGRVRQASRRK
jgi:hypothetical protein